MSYHPYAERDAIKNYFALPNEIFSLDLSTGALAVYAYLLSLENRKTFRCWPSYTTIGKHIGKCKKSVQKYVRELVDKCLITTEETTVITKKGIKRNGTLMYTIRPIQEAIEYNYQQQMKLLELGVAKKRAAMAKTKRSRKEPPCPTISLTKEPVPADPPKEENSPLVADLGEGKEKAG